ncbi:NADP-dependent oxidoreductase [Pseudoalteromonas luteoviolacea]|uniref:NADP-dependent oxidoreductase n=1 Tax=Pseudoalteromonas luteoviolacea TaxID=43657 RepID=UPI001B3A7063|nr:NADP-dependent oxidoreductase [Pseudoalteromonas luteoviolacea]MBQ4877421.1 NADP-dependent oxidoreductase [Pseudoalteromonas luteoviolacea]MBQ4906480.1 NADP-dependent oxidoreductase [Pseudoalteromonas luteoviolacea]
MNKNYKQAGVVNFGTADRLQIRSLPQPTLERGQVFIRITSSSINPIDVKTRAGLGYVAQSKQDGAFLPLGYDVLGIIEEVSEGVNNLAVGDTVLGMVGFPSTPGCYASHVIVESEEIIVVDSKVSDEFAGLSLAGLTALQSLNKLNANAGTLFINAPTGGVGHLAIQLAVLNGFDVVAVTTRKALIESLNFDVATMSYEEFFDQPQSGQLLDLVGGELACKMLSHMEAGTSFVTVPSITKDAVIEHGASFGAQGDGILVQANPKHLNELYKAVATQRVKLVASKKFKLDEVALAHKYVEQGEHFGKVIIVA